jgi:hypothetical protein
LDGADSDMPAIMQDLITPGRVTAAEIAHALGARRVGQNRWMARCPAHRERTPSLSIAEGRDGRALVHCFAGCEQIDVIAALRGRGLWSAHQCTAHTLSERRAYRRYRAALARDLAEARWWGLASGPLAELLLEEIDLFEPDREAITEVVSAARNNVLGEYWAWYVRNPKLTKALVEAGRRHDERMQTLWARRFVSIVNDRARS